MAEPELLYGKHDGRMLAKSATYVILKNLEGKFLLLRRHNTSYLNGYYDVPSGHVEYGETLTGAALRELKEEAGVYAEPSALKLWHINQFYANGEVYYCFYFLLDLWTGEPRICEPHRCDDMGFFALDDMPNLTPATRLAFDHINDPPVSLSVVTQEFSDEIVKGSKG